MDATKFTAMHAGPSASGGGLSAVLTALDPREMAAEAYATVSSWTALAVSQCFTKMRRPQFDEEHQRSLLSCHTTEDDDGGGFSAGEEAMLELRRRVQNAPARPMSFAQELEATYHRHKAMQLDGPVRAAAPARRVRDKAASADACGDSFWSDSDQALHDILHAKPDGLHRVSDPGKADDLRRLSVDELLALRVPSPTSTSTLSIPDRLGSDTDEPTGEIHAASEDGRALREWLQGVDAARAGEFLAYARAFETQGFTSLADLAQLDESDVEQAMSEVGISKFAHRARLRKAILRLSLDGTSALGDAVSPALAG